MVSKPNRVLDLEAFHEQVRSEAQETSLRAFSRTSFLAGFVFLAPTVFLDSVGGAYDPWIRASHLVLAVAGFAFAWATRAQSTWSKSAQGVLAPLYVLGVNLSQLILVQRLREPLDITPALLTIVVLALVDLPLGWFVATVVLQTVSILSVAISQGWTDEWISAWLVTMAVVAVFSAVWLNRRVHRRRIESLRAEQLAAQAALEREMEERSRLQEREITNEKLQSLGRLAGGVAHDLNNLLVPIMGNVDMLMDDEVTDERRERLGEVMDAAQRARLLTRQLTAFAGKGGPADEVFDLAQEVTETRQLVLRTVPKPCTIAWEAPGTPTWITGDRAQVQQALLNLLLNAAEAVESQPDGTVHLTLDPAVPGPDESTGPYARVVVTDEGPGIPDGDGSRIFDPFFTTKGSGRGLGLSATLGAVRRHGGHVIARNTADRGAEFSLYLRRAHGPTHTEPEARGPNRGAGRVLVVDDDAPVRAIARRTLESAGFIVETAASGSDALDVATAPDALDAAVVDLRMPGLDGRETIRLEVK
ncbi:MAG: ATP-binding protein [Gemmatimonadota bacterium]